LPKSLKIGNSLAHKAGGGQTKGDKFEPDLFGNKFLKLKNQNSEQQAQKKRIADRVDASRAKSRDCDALQTRLSVATQSNDSLQSPTRLEKVKLKTPVRR